MKNLGKILHDLAPKSSGYNGDVKTMRYMTEESRKPPQPFGHGNSGYRPAPQGPPPRRTGTNSTEVARRRAQKRRRHRRHILIFFYTSLFLVALSAAAILSFTVLFKVTSVSVEGTSRYQQQKIINASGIKTGDNLFRVNTNDASQKICKKLPYLETATVSRKFPASIVITVKETSVWGAVKNGSKYLLLGGNGKILENVSAPPKGCTELLGLSVKKTEVGLPIGFANQNQASLYETVLGALQKSSIDKITSIDFSQVSRILIIYDGRITINLGDPDDLDFKLKFARELLKSNIKSTEKGTLDMSVVSATNKAYFDADYSTASSAEKK